MASIYCLVSKDIIRKALAGILFFKRVYIVSLYFHDSYLRTVSCPCSLVVRLTAAGTLKPQE